MDDFMSDELLKGVQTSGASESTWYSERKAKRRRTEDVKPASSPAVHLVDDPSNQTSKAVQMMLKMGYSAGSGLGRSGSTGRTEPIEVEVKRGRTGIAVKPTAEEPHVQPARERSDDYRSAKRLAFEQQRENGRREAVKRLLYNLGEEDVLDEPTPPTSRPASQPPSTPFDVLGVREESYSKTIEDETEDKPETLSPTPSPPPSLSELLARLRTKYHYCFWCGVQYGDQTELEASCPGEAEVDHD